MQLYQHGCCSTVLFQNPHLAQGGEGGQLPQQISDARLPPTVADMTWAAQNVSHSR